MVKVWEDEQGNLMRVPDSTWIMEFATAWHLVYRTEEQMLDLASEISSTTESIEVQGDSTGHCLFLDVRRGSE